MKIRFNDKHKVIKQSFNTQGVYVDFQIDKENLFDGDIIGIASGIVANERMARNLTKKLSKLFALSNEKVNHSISMNEQRFLSLVKEKTLSKKDFLNGQILYVFKDGFFEQSNLHFLEDHKLIKAEVDKIFYF